MRASNAASIFASEPGCARRKSATSSYSGNSPRSNAYERRPSLSLSLPAAAEPPGSMSLKRPRSAPPTQPFLPRAPTPGSPQPGSRSFAVSSRGPSLVAEPRGSACYLVPMRGPTDGTPGEAGGVLAPELLEDFLGSLAAFGHAL